MRLKNIKGASEKILLGKYFINNPNEYKGKWNKLFKNNNPIYIEIGMGKGNFIIKNALDNPNINYIGIEMYDSVILRAVEKTNELELNNLYLIRMDARLIEEVFDKEIDLIYLSFSDPWPKDRHAKRRLTSPRFLERYSKIFRGNNKIIMKTDNIDLFNYSVESLKEYGYNIDYLTNDLHSLYQGEVYYFTVIGSYQELNSVYDMLKDNVNYNVTFQQEIYRDEYWLEIMPKTASKANAILKLKEILKCDEIVCFGDAINDLEMFKVSNQSYAMENAVDQLKKHATAIIDSNENDGVANWLIKNFK